MGALESLDAEKLGAGSGAESVEALPEAALEFVGSHAGRLRRRTVAPRVACLSMHIREHWRTLVCSCLGVA